MSLLDEARAFRSQVLATDTAASARLAKAYAAAFRRIDTDLQRTIAAIEQASAGGQRVTAAVLYQRERLERLRAQTLAEINRFSAEAQTTITAAIDTAAEQGRQGAARLVDEATPPGITASLGTNLPTSTVEALAGAFRSTAIQRMLAPLGTQAAASIEEALTTGVAMGTNPKVIAAQIRHDLGGNMVRALTISRTEVMRAHREAALSTYRANAAFVGGWVWVAGLGSRTCASCWAQHGSVHPLDEPMASHPRCRCVAVPQSRSWADLGFSGLSEPDPIEPGPAIFARSRLQTKMDVLGPSKLAAYQDGDVRLEDFVARRDDPLWGPSTRAAGLAEAKANAAARAA